MDKQLKPCPFCGGNARIYVYDPFDGYQGNLTTYRVECTKCRANIKNSKKIMQLKRGIGE